MPDWLLFAGVTILVSVAFVSLARASARVVRAALDARDDPTVAAPIDLDRLDSAWLLAENVLVSHGLVVVALLGTAWYARVPASTMGMTPPSADTVGLGVGLGVALAAANAGSVRLADRVGLAYDERLRALLAPDSTLGWLGLLLVVLPLVAVAEELLFRGALIGAFGAGFGWPLWGLAAVSSVLFGLGHGLQGPGGVVVTTGLGAVLAASFLVTGSLAVVVTAHYVVNALEFVLNEWPSGHR